jgi:hypothetical protein
MMAQSQKFWFQAIGSLVIDAKLDKNFTTKLQTLYNETSFVINGILFTTFLDGFKFIISPNKR